MNIGIFEALLIPDIALEADDITKQVNAALGGKNAPTENRSQDQREEDLTQVDNIFDDIKKDDAEDNPQDNPVNDDMPEDASTDEEPNGADELNATMTDDQGDNSDDPGMDESGDIEEDPSMDDTPMEDDPNNPDGEGMNPEDKSIFSDKNTLKKNMIYFFNIIRYTIASLEDALGSTDNQETLRVMNSVIQNLYSSKDVLFNLITKQIEKESYEILVTKYITIKRIYDISCDMLEEHLTNNPESRVKYKRFKNKFK